MTQDDFNRFCASLPVTTHVVQWGGSDVWKVGGKFFAMRGTQGGAVGVTFKVTPLTYEILSEQPGCRPAPYLASRGMKWIQRFDTEAVDDDALKAYIVDSYRLVAAKLTKKARTELGLLDLAHLTQKHAP